MTIRCNAGNMDDEREATVRRLKEIARRAGEKARLPVPPASSPPPPPHWSERRGVDELQDGEREA
jgi:hypothetical protein